MDSTYRAFFTHWIIGDEERQAIRDVIIIFVLSCLMALIFNKTNTTVQAVVLLTLSLIYLFSKNEPFWFVLFFLLIDSFSSLFRPQHGPIVIPVASAGLPFGYLMPILFTIKTFHYKRIRVPNHFRGPLIILSIVFILDILIGAYYGVSFNKFSHYFRAWCLFLFLFAIPRLMRTSEDWERLFFRMFLAAIPIFLIANYNIIFNTNLAFKLGAKDVFTGFSEYLVGEEDIALGRYYNSLIFLFVTFVAGLYYARLKSSRFPLWLLIISILLSAEVIVISMTRSYIIALFISILFLLLHPNKVLRARTVLAILGVVFAGGILFYFFRSTPILTELIDKSYERFLTIYAIFQGDLTAEGTLLRLTDRLWQVKSHYIGSQILGTGFSDYTYIAFDPHVASPSMILCDGYLGFSLWILAALFFVGKVYNQFLQGLPGNPYRFPIVVLCGGIIGLLVIHGTNYAIFSFLPRPFSFFAASLLITWINFNYTQSIDYRRMFLKSQAGRSAWLIADSTQDKAPQPVVPVSKSPTVG